jgi:hypothetical protein
MAKATPTQDVGNDNLEYVINLDDTDNPFITEATITPGYCAKTWPLPLPSTFSNTKIALLDLTALAEKELQL